MQKRSIDFPDQMLKYLQDIAEKNCISISAVVRIAVQRMAEADSKDILGKDKNR